MIDQKFAFIVTLSLCFPVFVPQMTGGVVPPGFETENQSISHSVLKLALMPSLLPGAAILPLRASNSEFVSVLGPLMANMLKSNLNCVFMGLSRRVV